MVKTLNCISLVIILISLNYIKSTKIVFVKSKPNDYLIKNQQNKLNALLENNSNEINDSEKICKSILETFHVLGKESMVLYDQCKGKYELLGMTDKIMQLEKPDCYSNLSKLFCSKYIVSSEASSYDIELIKFILSLINQCINFESNGELKSEYNCPSLNEEKYTIEDSKEFCLKGEKKIVLIDSEDKETYEYIRVKDSKQSECINIVDTYNYCISSENILYPNYNYTQCFQSTNSLYIGNKIAKYTGDETALCRNYIFPSFASINLRSAIEINNEDICDKFDQKILKQHDAYSNGVENRIETANGVIQQKKNIITFVRNMIESSQELLNVISNIIHNWKKVKEDFTQKPTTIITNDALKVLELFIEKIDLLFELSINVKTILAQKEIDNEKLTKVIPYYKTLLSNCKSLFKDSEKQLEELVELLTKPIQANNELSQNIHLSKVDFNKSIHQNDTKLMQIITNVKSFLKYLREQLSTNRMYHEEEIKHLENDKENKVSYKDRLINQKNNYRSFILNPPL